MSIQPDDPMDLDSRAVSALTSPMTVLGDLPSVRHDDALYQVVSDSGAMYRVDTRAEACECPDCLHRGTECRHLKRVLYAVGRYAIPRWVDLSQVDPLLGKHVPGDLRVEGAHGPRVIESIPDETGETS